MQPPAAVSTRISYGDFLVRYDGQHVEWVDGEVVAMSPVNDRHQQVSGFLLTILNVFVEARRLGIVRYEPFHMKTGESLPGRSPDVLFLAEANRARLEPSHLKGPADLVVEVISPDSRARDRGEKFYEYEQGGVREYWLIDPIRKQAEFYVLGEDRLYHVEAIGADGVYRSRVLDGLWLRTDWLWQEPPPPVLSVLREWGLV